MTKALPAAVPVNSLQPFAELDTKGISQAVSEYQGDRVALDKALRGAETNSQAARLLNAWQWGRENEALTAAERGSQGGRGNIKLVQETGENELALAKATAAKYRKIARVPLSRLEAWMEAQRSAGEATTFAAFELSAWYEVEGYRKSLKDHRIDHPDLDMGAKHDLWNDNVHGRRVYLLTLVSEMDAGAKGDDARIAAYNAQREAYDAARSHDFESYRSIYMAGEGSPTRHHLERWLSLARTDAQTAEAEAALSKYDAEHRMTDFVADLDSHITAIDRLFDRVPVAEVTQWTIDTRQFDLLTPYRERLQRFIDSINARPVGRRT